MKFSSNVLGMFPLAGLLNSSRAIALAVSVLLTSGLARADIAGPYSPDASTLHLWHLDESAVPAFDSGVSGTNLVGLLNGATLGSASFSGFGSALNTVDGGQDSTTERNALLTASAATPNPGNVSITLADSTTGSFTFEAIVRIGFDPAKNFGTTANGGNNRNTTFQIMSGESTTTGNRIFQFRIFPVGIALTGGNPGLATVPLLAFENVRAGSSSQPSLFAAIPTTGPDAIVSNNWYHVAVTYNGAPNTPNNFKFYWTLLDSSRGFANQISITSVQTTFSGLNPLSTVTTPFVLGNEARNRTSNFIGLVDEARISRVERKATEMMFSSTNPVVVTPPASQTVGLGDSTSFSVLCAGSAPLSYQWRHDGTNIADATQDIFLIPSTQFTDVGSYDVVVTNDYGSATSAVGTLDVRLPLDLTWNGSAGAIWETSLINWDTNADTVADAVYSERDSVTFNDAGSGAPVVLITNILSPNSITINASSDYTLTTTNAGGIGGSSRLLKSGTGKLIVDTDNSFVGPTTIQGGVLQIGNGGARGSLGNGPVTNNAGLIFFRTGTITLNNPIAGTGGLTNNATNTITINATNTLTGPVMLNAGALVLNRPPAQGNSTEYILNATASSSPTRLAVGGGITFGPDKTISFLGTTAVPDYRCTLSSLTSTNTFNCNLILGGDGIVNFNADGGVTATNVFQVVTPLISSPAFTGKLVVRGGGNGIFTSQVNIGGQIVKTDSSTWIMTSTGNSWTNLDVAVGTLRMGAHGVLPATASLNFPQTTATLDLAGFNQQASKLAGVGLGIIGNSSTNSDSILTVNPPGISLYSGSIRDSVAGGTRKVGLTIAGGVLGLAGTNTYSGITTIAAGATLELQTNGSILNSETIDLATGATLNASLRTDGTLTLAAGQTLKGDGAFNVQGNLVSSGTIELKLLKSGAILSNDSINNINTITYGGTLKPNITASPALTTNDTFKLFNAGTYSGAFTDIIPGPGVGLAWDTSTLTADGTLRIATNPTSSVSTNMTVVVTGNQIDLSWPEGHIGWRLQVQTNSLSVGISTNWFDVAGSSTTNRVVTTINAGNGCVFYRMVYP